MLTQILGPPSRPSTPERRAALVTLSDERALLRNTGHGPWHSKQQMRATKLDAIPDPFSQDHLLCAIGTTLLQLKQTQGPCNAKLWKVCLREPHTG
eukprot:g4525.t1